MLRLECLAATGGSRAGFEAEHRGGRAAPPAGHGGRRGPRARRVETAGKAERAERKRGEFVWVELLFIYVIWARVNNRQYTLHRQCTVLLVAFF